MKFAGEKVVILVRKLMATSEVATPACIRDCISHATMLLCRLSPKEGFLVGSLTKNLFTALLSSIKYGTLSAIFLLTTKI